MYLNNGPLVQYFCQVIDNLASNTANNIVIKSLGGVAFAYTAKKNHADNVDVQRNADRLLARLQ